MISNTNTIARLIDGMGFRYRWATEDFTENEINFRPVEGSMNMMELIKHIHYLAEKNARSFGLNVDSNDQLESFEELRNSTVYLCYDLANHLRAMSDEELIALNPKRYWNLLNGPIADALTHIGQITSWRRISGNPQPAGVNVFFGTKA